MLLDALRGMAGGALGRTRSRARSRRTGRHGGRIVAALLGPVVAASSSLVPATVTAAVAAGVTAAVVATAAPAKASGGLPVLVIKVNGESSAPEAALLSAAGYSVTQDSVATLEAMSQSTFQGYAAVVIGDPSSGGSCPTSWKATSSTVGGNWEGWVTGHVAVLGTAPELAAGLASPGNTAADTLITDTAQYAAAQPGTGVTQTGLYLSLDCAYSTAAKGTAVSVLSGVEGIGTAGGVTVNGSLACADSGTVNSWEADAAGTYGGFASASLAAGAPGWPSPGCPVQEAFDSWPAMLAPVAYDAASDATADFTASDGATGQAYVLLGAPASAATQALAPSMDGEVPAGATAGGGANPAAAGVSQALAAGSVNTEDGDLTQSDADLSIPTYGPSLGFTRTYDAGAAQQQTQTGAPGALGYGWTDNWASSLTTGRPVAGDIYTLDGLRTNIGAKGPPASLALGDPAGVAYNGGNAYFADSAGNVVFEVPGSTGTQWGVPMTAGDAYVVAGAGAPAGGTLNHPQGIAFDSSGDLFIADTWDSRIEEIAVSTKSQWGLSLTAGRMTTIAGSPTGASGNTGDGGAPTSALLSAPAGIAFDPSGYLYIADGGNNRVQEVPTANGSQWGITVTANDIYTIAGSAAGAAGISGDGGVSRNAYLDNPTSVSTDPGGDVYIADSANNRVQEIAKAAGTQWGQSMSPHVIYTIAGSATGTAGTAGDGGAAASALLDYPQDALYSGGNLYIADAVNNRVQEVAGTAGTQWGQSMAAGDVYTIAGSSAGTAGFSGDGGAAGSAALNDPLALALDSSGNLYIADGNNNRVREVSASSDDISTWAGSAFSPATTGDGGPATQAGLGDPMQEAFDSRGDAYIADAGSNRIQEIASYRHTQYGIAMTAGDVYTIAGQADGQAGCQCDGRLATSAYLDNPWGITIDNNGNLYIADSGNDRIQEVPAVTGAQWGQSMTAGYMYTIAGNQYAVAGYTGDGGPAAAALLNDPNALTMDPAGDIYISDSNNSRVQEISAGTGAQWGQSMTQGDIYTIAGSATGAHGSTGDGGPATSALLYGAGGLALDSAGDLYIGDGGNNRVQELAASAHAQWGQSMTAGDIYTVTGGPGGGDTGDGGPASAAQIDGAPSLAIDASGDLYIADEQNNRIQEIANVPGTQWGQSMTAGDEYTVAGSATAASGNSGDGGPATTALMANTRSVSNDPEGDLYVTDNANDTVREVASAVGNAIAPAPGQTSALAVAPSGAAPGGLTITQPGGAQVTFWAMSGGACTSPYVISGSGSGGYCVLPQDQTANLTYNPAGGGSYTFTASPGTTAYTYAAATGVLASEADTAGNTLAITHNSPSPGGTVTTGGGSGACPSSASSCETITSASGRALILGYDAAGDGGQVTSVTDPMNRTWTYAYNIADQLISASDPKGNVTSYTYGVGSGNTSALLTNDLLTLTAPSAQPGGPHAGDATVNVYDNVGQVVSQTDPMGYTTTFSYCVNAAVGDCMNSATGSGLVTVTDPDGNKAVYEYEQGTLAALSSFTGATLTSEQDDVPDATAGGSSGGTLLDTSRTDGDGSTTTFNWNNVGEFTSGSEPGPSGQQNTTTAQYTTLRNMRCVATAMSSPSGWCSSTETGPAAVAPGGVITPPSSVPPEGVTYTLYDTDGNELYTTTGVYEPGAGSAAYSQSTYQLFKNNSVTLNGTNITCANNTPPSLSLPCAKINADGVVTQLAYSPEGDLASSSAPDGNTGGELATTSYVYDADGEQTSATAPDGNLPGANAGNYTAVTAYNSDGQKTTITQAGGSGATVTPRTTTYGYDADGNQTTVKDARTYTTTTTYNADDEPSLVTNPDNDSTLTCYDGDGHIAQTVPAIGVAANSLGVASCPASYPSGYSTRLASDATVDTFNALDQKVSETSPAPSGQSGYETTTYAYDANGNLTQTTAPPASTGGPSAVTANTYNPDGSLATETTGYGTSAAATTSYCYDSNGNQTAVIAPDGNISGVAPCESSYPWVVNPGGYPTQAAYQAISSFDSVGGLTSTTTPATAADPSGATTSYTYDPAGNALSSTSQAGVTTSFTYTPIGHIATVSYSGSSAHAVAYSYDANGNKTGMSDATGSSAYVYDPFGEVTSAQNGAGQTVSYSYDADGDTTGITYPLPGTHSWAATTTVGYGYDNADIRTSVTDFNRHQITMTPNADGLTTTTSLGATGDSINTAYDNTDMPSGITLKNSSTTLQSFTYSDSPGGTIMSETDTPSSASSPADYAYDARGQVTSDTPGSGSAKSYSFDPSGNLTTLPTGAAGTYDDGGELTSSVLSGTATSYTYNADGQQTSATSGGTTIASATWNGAEELTSYDNSSANMTAATYDGDGLRASDTVSSTSQSYTWDSTTSVPQLLMDSSNAYIYGDGGTPVEQISLAAGTVSYLVTDSLGSVRGIVNPAGGLTATTTYDAWGNPETTGGLTAYTPVGFAGGYTDPTGLIYLLARYYAPETGQFLSIDPKVGQTQDPYSYADGNPVSNTDPSGCHACLGTSEDPNDLVKVHFWRTKRTGTLGWDLWLTIVSKAYLGPEVITSMVFATVNGSLINPPYGPHPRPNNYDFHSSMLRYQIIGHKTADRVIATNYYIQFQWWIEGTPYWVDTPEGWQEETPNEFIFVGCSIPPKGSGVAGPYGPRMNQ